MAFRSPPWIILFFNGIYVISCPFSVASVLSVLRSKSDSCMLSEGIILSMTSEASLTRSSNAT
uniref:Uncharacterized protein n=1 Tax=Lepeophtheirus salmonis TaxID=72036 RepID=A0A0K2VAR0_LEPSM